MILRHGEQAFDWLIQNKSRMMIGQFTRSTQYALHFWQNRTWYFVWFGKTGASGHDLHDSACGGEWDSILLKIIPSCVFSSDNCDIWADLQRSWRFCWTVAGRRLREPLQWRAPMWSQHRGTDEWTQQVQPSLFWQYRKVPLKKTNAWADTLYTQLTTRSSACTPSVTIYLHLSMYVPCRGINSRGIQLHS